MDKKKTSEWSLVILVLGALLLMSPVTPTLGPATLPGTFKTQADRYSHLEQSPLTEANAPGTTVTTPENTPSNPDAPAIPEEFRQRGLFEYCLPSTWSVYEEHTNAEYLSFRQIVDGQLRYIVRIRTKGFLVRNEGEFKSIIASLTKNYAEKNHHIDLVEEHNRYTTLGVERCHMLSYFAPDFNHRGFLFCPVVNGKLYYVAVFDKTEHKKELRPEAADFIAGLWVKGTRQEELPPGTTGTAGSLTSLEVEGESIPAAQPIPFLDIKTITASQWDGAVAGAMEGMRLFYGPMNETEEAEFMKVWAPLRQTPFREAVDYLNKFNPLLGEFLVYRTAVVQTSQLLEEAVRNAGYAAEFDDPGVSEIARNWPPATRPCSSHARRDLTRWPKPSPIWGTLPTATP